MEELERNWATVQCSALKLYQDRPEQFLKSVISLASHPRVDSEDSQSKGEEDVCSVHVCGLAGTAASQENLANRGRQWEGSKGSALNKRRLAGTEGCQYQVVLSWELCHDKAKVKITRKKL